MNSDAPALPRREQIFDYIVAYKRDHDGLAPSVQEIADALCVGISTARYHLLMLEKAGRIRVIGRRAIEVTGGVWNPPDDG